FSYIFASPKLHNVIWYPPSDGVFVVKLEVKYEMNKKIYNTNLRIGSLFDGIGVLPIFPFGISSTWASGIEKAHIPITKRYFPNMIHFGDITKVNGREISSVRTITFSSLCKYLSNVGKREGLVG